MVPLLVGCPLVLARLAGAAASAAHIGAVPWLARLMPQLAAWGAVIPRGDAFLYLAYRLIRASSHSMTHAM